MLLERVTCARDRDGARRALDAAATGDGPVPTTPRASTRRHPAPASRARSLRPDRAAMPSDRATGSSPLTNHARRTLPIAAPMRTTARPNRHRGWSQTMRHRTTRITTPQHALHAYRSPPQSPTRSTARTASRSWIWQAARTTDALLTRAISRSTRYPPRLLAARAVKAMPKPKDFETPHVGRTPPRTGSLSAPAPPLAGSPSHPPARGCHSSLERPPFPQSAPLPPHCFRRPPRGRTCAAWTPLMLPSQRVPHASQRLHHLRSVKTVCEAQLEAAVRER